MSSGGPFGTAVEAKRLVENLLSDLRTLSTEAKKKHSQVKEVITNLLYIIILSGNQFYRWCHFEIEYCGSNLFKSWISEPSRSSQIAELSNFQLMCTTLAVPVIFIIATSDIFQAAESGLVKIKNISAASNEQNLLTNIRCASAELLQPLILGCSSKNARLVQVSLQAIQKMVQHRVIESVRFRIMYLSFSNSL